MRWINYEIKREWNNKMDYGLKCMRLLTYIIFYPLFYIVGGKRELAGVKE